MRKIIFIFLFLFLSITYLPITGEVELKENKNINTYHKNNIVGTIDIKNTNFTAYLVENNSKDSALSLNVNHVNTRKNYSIYADEENHSCEISNELINYLEETYYMEHKILTLTINHEKENYSICSILKLPENNDFFKIPYEDKVTYIKNNSLYLSKDEIEDNTNMLFLNTCYYPTISSSILITAKKISKSSSL